MGFLVILPSLLTVLLCNFDHIGFSKSLLVSATCHTVYNVVSLTMVLAIFNPVQHSLLNVGKRISIVIALYLFSKRSFNMINIVSAGVCLVVSVLGVRVVKDSEDSKPRLSKKSWGFILLRYT